MTVTAGSDEIRDVLAARDFVENPYPAYERLLKESPIYWSSPTDLLVAEMDTCRRILSDPATFGQKKASYPNFHSMNPPEHTRLRKLVSRVFTPRAIHNYRHRIEFFVDRLLTELQPRGQMELISEFAQPLPTLVITEMLGVPYEDGELWETWANAIHQHTAVPEFLNLQKSAELIETAAKAAKDETEYFRALVAKRRVKRSDDIVSLLVSAEEDGDHLSEEELLYTLVLLLGAGHHTSVNLIGNGMRALMGDPVQYRQLCEDPALIDNAIEEMLRFDPPLQGEPRVALQDAEIEGVKVPEGTVVHCLLAAANRDPSVFENPSNFRIDRDNAKNHIAFSLGIHHCLGAPLARAEGQIAFRELVKRMPSLRAAGDAKSDGLYRLRGLASLPLEWDV